MRLVLFDPLIAVDFAVIVHLGIVVAETAGLEILAHQRPTLDCLETGFVDLVALDRFAHHSGLDLVYFDPEKSLVVADFAKTTLMRLGFLGLQ